MVERFFLPDSPTAAQALVDRSRRGSFDQLHDSGQREYLLSLLVHEWSKNHVNMVWHDHYHVEFIPNPMVMAARQQDDIPGDRWQYPSKLRDKGDEVRREIPLQVRQITAVKLHVKFWHAKTRRVTETHQEDAEYSPYGTSLRAQEAIV